MTVGQAPQRLTQRQERWRAQYGPWTLVTGASNGIGRALAICLAEAGLNLVLVARRHNELAALASRLGDRHGIETQVVAADLGERDAPARVIEAVRDRELGLLVACAGFGSSGRLIDASLSSELNMIDVNCGAVLAFSRHFGRQFAEQGRGGIILMSSLFAFQGVPLAANYAATKAYVQALAEGLRLELGPLGVDVLACAPGPVHSGFAARADMVMGLGQQPESIARPVLKALGRQTTVRPGWLAKCLEASFIGQPRAWRGRILKQVVSGMIKHQPPTLERHP